MRCCFVMECTVTSSKNPDKRFITMPRKEPMRTNWLKALGLDVYPVSEKSCVYVCEDHFDLEKDVLNWRYIQHFKNTRTKTKVQLAPGVVPHIFECSPSWREKHKKRSSTALEKLTRKRLVNELLKAEQTAPVSIPKPAKPPMDYSLPQYFVVQNVNTVKKPIYNEGHNENLEPEMTLIKDDTSVNIDFDLKPDPEYYSEVMVDTKELMKSTSICIVDSWDSTWDITCCIFGCLNTTYNCTNRGVEMYDFPKKHETERLQAWISAVRQLNSDVTWECSTFSRICSQHFMGGKKSNIKTDISYVPTIKIKSEIDVQIKCEFENYTEVLESSSFQDVNPMLDNKSEFKYENI